MMRSSQLMSSYIHYAVTQKHENIWIAQREGRAKDSSDHTQDSVLKMLAMGSSATSDSAADKLRDLNIVPLTISYEFDPCDYLKAQEFQQKRDNPAFKKSRQDDLDNMKTGIFGYKGRVRYTMCCSLSTHGLTNWLTCPKTNCLRHELSQRMDREIYRSYTLYPCNYIALDELEGTNTHASHYTKSDHERFEKYLYGQLAKIKYSQQGRGFPP